MENVTSYIKKYWMFFLVLLFWCGFIGWYSQSNSVNADTLTDNLPQLTAEQNKVSAQILAIQKAIEQLQRKDSAITQQISKIDSLRLENARNTPNQSVRTHYSDLSKRYANDRRIK